jgi:glycosyltransferase involved in cell wall biosynthesis
MRVALLSHSARAGDAIGNHVADKLAFFHQRGAEARVFVETVQALHPAVRAHAQVVDPAGPRGSWWQFVAGSDLVIAEFGHGHDLLNLLPLLAGARPRVLVDYHGVTPPALWGRHNREALERGVAQRGLVWCADGVLVHSRFTWRELHEQCRYPAGRLFQVAFPLDLGFWSPGPSRLRRRLGLEGATVLLFVGRLAPSKRVPLLVEALARLRDNKPDVHAVVIGDQSDVYQAEAMRCRQRAAGLGVADRLHLLGHVSQQALRAVYRAADVLVMPSVSEGFCLPVLEAMACGVPVVAARAAALPETLGDAGLTFVPDDVDDLVLQLRQLLRPARTALGEELHHRGRQRAQGFSAAAWAGAFGAVVEKVLDAAPRPCRHRIEIRQRRTTRGARLGQATVLVAARAKNRGSHAVLAEGPGRTVFRCRVVDETGQVVAAPPADAPLPGLLMPGESRAVAIAVPVPSAAGAYHVDLWAEPAETAAAERDAAVTSFRLVVLTEEANSSRPRVPAGTPDLAEAHRLQCLPDDYLDISEGLLGPLKLLIKRKVLGNFKTTYVDVLSRQQSAFNREILAVVQDLAERCVRLEGTVRVLTRRLARQPAPQGEVCP